MKLGMGPLQWSLSTRDKLGRVLCPLRGCILLRGNKCIVSVLATSSLSSKVVSIPSVYISSRSLLYVHVTVTDRFHCKWASHISRMLY